MEDAFLPTTPEEVRRRGWDRLDVILVSGDSYIDSPLIGVAVIGRVLEQAGFKVGIIAQPQIDSPRDITRLGEPRLFWGVTGGSVDSMVANYSASRRKRRQDDYTPGGLNNRRPDRAVIAYCNLIRRYFKDTVPLLLGGIEASLRRVPHYDYWSDSVRRSILFDAKADYLLYGMAEGSVLAFAQTLKEGGDPAGLRGLCCIRKNLPEFAQAYRELPPYEEVAADKQAFTRMFHLFYRNNDPLSAAGLYQKHGERYLIHNPPAAYASQAELDAVYALPYRRAQHPYYESQGAVKALETIRFSINSHHGCYGECNFCAIAAHEGRTVRWRSPQSILAEARLLTELPGFKGYILDVGGPTANMYGFECARKLKKGACPDKRCIYPQVCPSLKPDHDEQVKLLRSLRRIPGIKKVFIGSGLRYDLILADHKNGRAYLRELTGHHVSGQLKVAPEHSQDNVLAWMGKPQHADLLEFKRQFDELSQEVGLRQYLTYYLIAAHPGCTEADMRALKAFASRELHISPEQVQIFTPLPSTYSALMYYTETDPFTGEKVFVEKDMGKKEKQKRIVVKKNNNEKNDSKTTSPSE
ncbi:MAG: YgiQ family radical SAM protein [Anaerolineae bacterium]|nr:YgiQ family radical SAM protein [Anaerolineae bacterium]